MSSLSSYLSQVDLGLFANGSLEELCSILDTFADRYFLDGHSFSELATLEETFLLLSAGNPMTIDGYQALRHVLNKVEDLMDKSNSLQFRVNRTLPNPGLSKDEYDDAVIALGDRALYLVQTWQVQEAHLNWLWTLVRQEGPQFMERFITDACLFPDTPIIQGY